MSKKILIVSRAFYPIIAPRAFRATELAKEFAKKGNTVHVLTNKRNFDYTDFESKYKVVIDDFTGGKWKEIKGDSIPKRVLRAALSYFFLYPDIQLSKMVKNSLKTKSDFDLLVSIANPYPVHWGVALAKDKNFRLTKLWIADCGDPFMGNKEERLKRPFYFKLIENWFCRKPDFITVPIEDAISAYPSFCKDKIRVIPQGFNFEDTKFVIKDRLEDQVTFGYAGALSKGVRDPSAFLEYLCSKQDLNFKFIVYTKNNTIFEPFKSRLNNRLELRDYVSRDILLHQLAGMDFLVNIENRDTVQSPSKLIDYALVNRPILSIKPFDVDKGSVDQFLRRDYTNQYVVKNIDKYDIKNVANEFLKLTDL